MKFIATFVIYGFALFSATDADVDSSRVRQWHQWRGPLMNGVAPNGDPPVEWSEQKNVKWKVEIPGLGHSTPIVWGDLVIVQTAIRGNRPGTETDAQADADSPDGAKDGAQPERSRGERGGRGTRASAPTEPHRFVVMALDRSTGTTVWQRTVREVVPHEGSHQDGSLAPSSPVTDGKHVFAYFGSRGLYALTMQGEVVWEKDLGDMRTRNAFGEGSTPALHGDTLVVNWDHEGDDFIVALDKRTGAEKWRRERDEPTTWSTPLILEDRGKVLAVVSATNRTRAYDVSNGNIEWECGGLGLNSIPTPVADDTHVIVMTGFRDPKALAIRYRDASGDITDSATVTWQTDDGTSYVPSPLLYGDTLYYLQKNTGILSCVDPQSGRPYYDKQRLEGIEGVYASPVGAGDRVYVVGRNGTTAVLKRGHAFETLAVNELDDSFSASPAVAGRELFLRGAKYLYCIAAP